jgi:hypothetical protein
VSCWGQIDNRLLVQIWRIAHFYLMWCLWKEQNAPSFENCETSLLNLKKLALQTLFTWRVMLTTMSDCTFSNFLDLCSSFSMDLGFLYTLCVLWVAPLCAFLKYTLLIKKEATLQPRTLTKPPTTTTSPTRTNYDLVS